MSEPEELSAIGGELSTFESRLLRLLALMLVEKHSQPEQVRLLTRSGFKPAEIAPLLGTTPNTVSVINYQDKKRHKKGARKKKQ